MIQYWCGCPIDNWRASATIGRMSNKNKSPKMITIRVVTENGGIETTSIPNEISVKFGDGTIATARISGVTDGMTSGYYTLYVTVHGSLVNVGEVGGTMLAECANEGKPVELS